MNTTPFPSLDLDPDFQALLKTRPCQEAIDFIRSFPTKQAAWDACNKPSWLLWYLKSIGRLNKKETDAILTQIIYKCQELSLSDPTPRVAWRPTQQQQQRILKKPYGYGYGYAKLIKQVINPFV